MKAYCLDSFALIAYLHDEKGASVVESLLKQAQRGKIKVYMHQINVGEFYYIIWREEGESAADAIYAETKELPIIYIDDLGESFLLTVAKLKAKYPISYADAFTAGLAQQKGAVVLTGDPEFKSLRNGILIEWLN